MFQMRGNVQTTLKQIRPENTDSDISKYISKSTGHDIMTPHQKHLSIDVTIMQLNYQSTNNQQPPIK